jgi:hypothetical protein
MAGTHQRLLNHIVFSTKNRTPYLSAGHRNEVFASMLNMTFDISGRYLGVAILHVSPFQGFDAHLAIDPGPYGTRQGLCGPFGPKTGNGC